MTLTEASLENAIGFYKMSVGPGPLATKACSNTTYLGTFYLDGQLLSHGEFGWIEAYSTYHTLIGDYKYRLTTPACSSGLTTIFVRRFLHFWPSGGWISQVR